QRPIVAPGASRTPPWGLGAPAVASVPPPALSRTEPPEPFRRSEPPPSFRGSRRKGKVVGVAALMAAAALSMWTLRNRRPPTSAASIVVAEASDRAAPKPAPAEVRPAEPVRPGAVGEPPKSPFAVAPATKEV